MAHFYSSVYNSLNNKWEDRGDHIVIFINYKGAILETKISPEDLPKVDAFLNTWSIHESNCNIYVRGKVERYSHTINVYLARYIMDCPEWLFVDHINRSTLDNQRGNLRIVTRSIEEAEVAAIEVRSSLGLEVA